MCIDLQPALATISSIGSSIGGAAGGAGGFTNAVVGASPYISAAATLGQSFADYSARSEEASFANARARAEYQRQVAERDQIVEYNAQQRINELTARNLQINALAARGLEEVDASAERGDTRRVEARRATGRVTAAAASNGVAGNTVSALLGEQFTAASRAATADAANLTSTIAQLRRETDAAEQTAKSRIDALRDPLPIQAPILRRGPSALSLVAGVGRAVAGLGMDLASRRPRGEVGTMPASTATSATPASTEARPQG